MASRVVLPLLMAILLSGCGKSPSSTSVSTSEPAQGEKTGGAPPNEQMSAAEMSEAALNAALAELTQAVRKYSFEHQRVPKTIGELVAAGYLKTMPLAPAGKKFAIEAKNVQVVLVNQ
jgi:hypothetical protein